MNRVSIFVVLTALVLGCGQGERPAATQEPAAAAPEAAAPVAASPAPETTELAEPGVGAAGAEAGEEQQESEELEGESED